MARKSQNVLICPSCKSGRYFSELTMMSKAFGDGFFEEQQDWACDVCLRAGKADIATITKQNYCWHPRYAYFDSHFQCTSCGIAFVFDRSEKRFWYETLGFWIESEPRHCPACRKEVRQWKSENTKLSELLRKGETALKSADVEEIIRIYEGWHLSDKVKYYKSLLSKL